MRSSLEIVLTDELVQEIGRIGVERAPAEACGVITPTPFGGRQVFEMPNRAPRTHENFMFTTEDVWLTLERYITGQSLAVLQSIAIWHTHPKGGIGPSQSDLEHRIHDTNHLVVAISDMDFKATWY